MNKTFYIVYAIILLICNVIFMERVIRYALLVRGGKERLDTEENCDKRAFIYNRLVNARLRFWAWLAIVFCGLYANIDCILNIWR